MNRSLSGEIAGHILAGADQAALEANFNAVMDELQRDRPASVKGRYIKKVNLSSTMGPSVKVSVDQY